MGFPHFEPVPHSCMNQSTDLDSQSIDWLQYEGDIGPEWVKMKLQYATASGIILFDGMRDTKTVKQWVTVGNSVQ